ncbi:hypothetical protein Tco_1404982 [Tanacetum coccineum]
MNQSQVGNESNPRQFKRGRDTKILQSSGPPKKVDDEVVHKELGDRMERAATTASSLEAEQDSGNISRTQFMATLNEPSPSQQTASTSTLKDGEVEITVTIDGQLKTITEASLRRHLKLEDADGITRFVQIFLNKHKRHLLPQNRTYFSPTITQKLFSNTRRASKGYTRVDIPLFPTMLVQGTILQGEGSTVPVESHHTPLGAPTTSQPLLSSPSRIPTRQETKVPHPSSPTYINVADEAAFISVDVVHGGAATTVSSIDAGHGSGNIPKSPTMPHELPLPVGHTPRSDEGSGDEVMELLAVLEVASKVVSHGGVRVVAWLIHH